MKSENILGSKLAQKKTLFGPFMKLPTPAITEIVGLAGFDFVIIDCEHGPLNMLVAEDLIRAAKLQNMAAVIRVSENNPVLISRALDIGADAVQIPQISTKEDAEAAVAAAKFYPHGERGVCKYVRSAGYSSIEKSDYFNNANMNIKIIIHIEGKEGEKNFEEILKVEGIDILFIGPYDLSQSLGIPGQVNHPAVTSRMEDMVKKAKRHNKIVGTFVDDVETAKRWEKIGVQYMSYSVDTGIIYNAFKNASDDLHEMIENR